MAGWTTPALVAAVSAAGGLGTLASARSTPAQLAADIDAVRRLTNRPFGVNFLLAPPEPGPVDARPMHARLNRVRSALGLAPTDEEPEPADSRLEEMLDLVEHAGVLVVSFAMGDPGPLVARFREAGSFVMATVTSVADARVVAERGVDAVIAQGFEAGGHRSTFPGSDPRRDAGMGTLALVPAVADAVGMPVVAAGGIVDGRGLAASLALGAEAVQMGTRFLLATESGATPRMRARLQAAVGADTRLTRALTGRPARALSSPLLDAIDSPWTPPLPWPLQAVAAEDVYRAATERDDPDWMPILAGQGLGGLMDAPAARIVAEVVGQAQAALRRATGSTPT